VTDDRRAPPGSPPSAARTRPASPAAAVSRRLAEHAGLELPAWVVEARAQARMALLDVDAETYEALVCGPRGAAELDELTEDVRVGETRLFRHRAQIAALADDVAARWRDAGKRTIRVWSAGCAAGEEPYTLACVLARAVPGAAISIVATDLSAEALAVARTATYPRAALAHVPDEYRGDFLADDDVIRVRPDLAALVRFEQANLVEPGAFAPSGCDLVWCRNVLIYFTPEARRRALERLVGALVPQGAIFAGYSESLREVASLDPVRAGDAVYYVKRPRTRPTTPLAVPIVAARGRTTPRTPQADASAPPKAASPIFVLSPDDRTPPPMRFPPAPPTDDTLALRGTPNALRVSAELSARFAVAGLARLVIDLDPAELLGDELAPVLRRARAAARAAGVELELRATRPGAKRWLSRHELPEGNEP
jgi:chemotaxis methyl-accepting protein methylase